MAIAGRMAPFQPHTVLTACCEDGLASASLTRGYVADLRRAVKQRRIPESCPASARCAHCRAQSDSKLAVSPAGGAAGPGEDHPRQRQHPAVDGVQLPGLLQDGGRQAAGHRARGGRCPGATALARCCIGRTPMLMQCSRHNYLPTPKHTIPLSMMPLLIAQSVQNCAPVD